MTFKTMSSHNLLGRSVVPSPSVSQWRPLMDEFEGRYSVNSNNGGASSATGVIGSGSANLRPLTRSITKNPQHINRNFEQSLRPSGLVCGSVNDPFANRSGVVGSQRSYGLNHIGNPPEPVPLQPTGLNANMGLTNFCGSYNGKNLVPSIPVANRTMGSFEHLMSQKSLNAYGRLLQERRLTDQQSSSAMANFPNRLDRVLNSGTISHGPMNNAFGAKGFKNGGIFSNGGPLSSYESSDMKIGMWNEVPTASSDIDRAFPMVNNFEIGTFNVVPGGSKNDISPLTSGSAMTSFGVRETGIIEKMLQHSYGFIQCCERQARLFFHFSQFRGIIEHLKIGDPVEFEMTYDRRTGKPIASNVSKIAPEVVSNRLRVIGSVTTNIKVDPETGSEIPGRISYENEGECFFLPFCNDDVEGNVTIKPGDKVSFLMDTLQRTGALVARTIRLENLGQPVKYRGVVTSSDGCIGMIERADVVKHICFHYSTTSHLVEDAEADIKTGDHVQFIITSRNGLEVACRVNKLPPGSVVFDDIGFDTVFTGQVLKTLDVARKHETEDIDSVMSGVESMLSGRLRYRGVDRSEMELPFGIKDRMGGFTLRHGDWVRFVIAIDRRNKEKRATNIELTEQSFKVSDERREQGMVQFLSNDSGHIRCTERSSSVFFHFLERLDVNWDVKVGDECEFTVTSGSSSSQLLAIRIMRLQSGTVSFDAIIHTSIMGVVDEVPVTTDNGSENLSSREGAGTIIYFLDGQTLRIPVYSRDCSSNNLPHKGDKVSFDINQFKSTKETNAVNVVILNRASLPIPQSNGLVTESTLKDEVVEQGQLRQGFVAALKDGFGFIETLERDKEVFFHFSQVDENLDFKLEVGSEVEYSFVTIRGGNKFCAENISVLPKGTIVPILAKEETLRGTVVRPLRSVNPDQDQYCGLIQVLSEDRSKSVVDEYEFAIVSLLNKKEILQIGDPVLFQASFSDKFAVRVICTREKLRANVESVKGHFGFLNYEFENSKKLFFHMSDVDNASALASGEMLLQAGDEVEFVLNTNKRTGKNSACCIKKISPSKRPDRLISRLKTLSVADAALGGPKIIVLRQPRGPSCHGFVSRSRISKTSENEDL